MTLPDLAPALSRLYGEPTPAFEVTALRGDASTRSYLRLLVSSEPTTNPGRVIAMCLPEDSFKSDEGGPPTAESRLPFLQMAELLHARGLPVPTIYVEDLDRGIILLEDLGDVTLETRLLGTPTSDWPALYSQAVELLASVHDRCELLPTGALAARRRFDLELLRWELEHFRQWGLEALFEPLSAAAFREVESAFSELVAEIVSLPYGFTHRDYQSRNLMVRGDDLTIIDFQDALQGPRAYDLAALLCDSYVPLEASLQDAMIEVYAGARGLEPEPLKQEFWLVALHRKLKDAGRFVFIDRVRNNPDFLQWYPQSLVYVGRALDRLSRFTGLHQALERAIPGFPDSVERPRSVGE